MLSKSPPPDSRLTTAHFTRQQAQYGPQDHPHIMRSAARTVPDNPSPITLGATSLGVPSKCRYLTRIDDTSNPA